MRLPAPAAPSIVDDRSCVRGLRAAAEGAEQRSLADAGRGSDGVHRDRSQGRGVGEQRVGRESPFAPEEAASRLAGYDAIAAYMRQLPEMIRFGTLGDAPSDLGDVWFITLHDGKVPHFRDYMNPLQLSHVTETGRG
jgi:hypothetical protein